jgi:hypothetical protein
MLYKDTRLLSIYYGDMTAEEIMKQEYPLVFSFNEKTKLMDVAKILKIEISHLPAFRVTFDSGLVIDCTPDHSFYTYRGYLRQAKDFEINQAVRAFSMSLPEKDGHYRVHGWVDGKPRHQYLARMIWEYFFGKIVGDNILHHKDFNKTNNDIKNLELLTNSFHNSVHYPHRRDGGFAHFSGNHKVVSADYLGFSLPMESILLDKNNSVVIPDAEPVSGCSSGIVSSSL